MYVSHFQEKREVRSVLLVLVVVTSLVSQLKMVFDDLGRKGEWTEFGLLKFGNPVQWCCHALFRGGGIRTRKGTCSGYTGKTPFLDKLKMMNNHLTENLDDHTISSGRRFVFLKEIELFRFSVICR